MQRLFRKYYLNQIIILQKQWTKLSEEIKFNGDIKSILKEILPKCIHPHGKNLRLQLDSSIVSKENKNSDNQNIMTKKRINEISVFDVSDGQIADFEIGHNKESQTQAIQGLKLELSNIYNCDFPGFFDNRSQDNSQWNENEMQEKQRKFLEITLKIQHIHKFLSETKEEHCDKSDKQKILRNAIWDYANTVYELLDKQLEDVQQCCILLANDRSSLNHFDSAALGISLFYYKCLQPAIDGKFYYSIMNLPKITYISFKKSWDGMTEEVLNWTPLPNINVNSAIQTIVITDSSFDYAPYNFNYYSQDSSFDGTRPNTYKICLDQVEFNRFTKKDSDNKSTQNEIGSDDIVYLFEKIIFPLVRSHGPNMIVMNHNFSYSNENLPQASEKDLQTDLKYNLQPVHFASILQSLGIMCNQKIILVCNNKFSDYVSQFDVFKKQNSQKNENMNTDILQNNMFENIEQIQKKIKLEDNSYQINLQQYPEKVQPQLSTQVVQDFNQSLSKKDTKLEEKSKQKFQLQQQNLIQNHSFQAFPAETFNSQDNEIYQQMKNIPKSKSKINYSEVLRQNEQRKFIQSKQLELQNIYPGIVYNNSNNEIYYPQFTSSNLPLIKNNPLLLENPQFLSNTIQNPQYLMDTPKLLQYSIQSENNYYNIQDCYQNLNQTNQNFSQFNVNLPFYPNMQQTQYQQIPERCLQFRAQQQEQFFSIPQQQQPLQNYDGIIQNQGNIFPFDQSLYLHQSSRQQQLKQQINGFQPIQQSTFREQIKIEDLSQKVKQEEKEKILKKEEYILSKEFNERIDLITKFYVEMLEEPILNNNGKELCFTIFIYFNMTHSIQELYLLQKKQMQEIQLEQSNQDGMIQNEINSLNQNEANPKKQLKLQQLEETNRQIEKEVSEQKIIGSCILKFLEKNEWKYSHFLQNWKIIAGFLQNEDEIEKYFLSQIIINPILVNAVWDILSNQNQVVTENQVRVVALIYTIHLRNKEQRNRQLEDLTIKSSNSFMKGKSSLERIFDKPYTDYFLQMIISAIYSASEIKDVSTTTYKKSYNYLLNINPTFQLYIQDINKQMIQSKKFHIEKYFFTKDQTHFNFDVRDTEIGYPTNKTNTDYVKINNNIKIKCRDQMAIELENNQMNDAEKQKQRDNEMSGQITNINYTENDKTVYQMNSIVDRKYIEQQQQILNERQISNQQIQKAQQMEDEDQQEQNDQPEQNYSDKIKNTLLMQNAKSSMESLKFKYSSTIKGLKYITNLKDQFFNKTPKERTQANESISHNYFKQEYYPQQQQQYSQQQIQSVSNEGSLYQEYPMHQQQPQQIRQISSIPHVNYNQPYYQVEQSIPFGQQEQYQQLQQQQQHQHQQTHQISFNNSNDKKLMETLKMKKLKVKRLINEIYDIRQQKAIKLITNTQYFYFDENCQTQVIYLPDNTIQVYIFNVQIKNKYYHAILTQRYSNSEVFDLTYITINQSNVSFSSSLCYSQNFVFKIFGVNVSQGKPQSNKYIEMIDRQTMQYYLIKCDNQKVSAEMISDFSSCCFIGENSQILISCFGGLDIDKKVVTQAGLIELNLHTLSYSWREVLNKTDFLQGYLEISKTQSNIQKKQHLNIQMLEESKKLQQQADKNVKDYWKRIPLFFSSSQSVYDELSDSIYVFGGNANNETWSTNDQHKQSIINSSLSCNSDCWEKYFCIIKFENVSSKQSLRDVIFQKLIVNNTKEIIYRNTIYQNEKKIEGQIPNYFSMVEKVDPFNNQKCVFTTQFRHNNIYSYAVYDQIKQEDRGNESNQMEFEKTVNLNNRKYTFVVQLSQQTQFKQSTNLVEFEKEKDKNLQPYQLISMAFSLHNDPLPKVCIETKLGN